MNDYFPSPIVDAQTRKDLGLIAAVGLLSIREIATRFNIKYRTVQTWKNAQTKKLAKLDDTAKAIQIERERIRLSKEYLQEPDNEIQPLVVDAEVEESVKPVADLETAPLNPTVLKDSARSSGRIYSEKSIESIVNNGIAAVQTTLEGLQNDSTGILIQERDLIQKLIAKAKEVMADTNKPSELSQLAKTVETLIKLERSLLLMPYGSTDPNKHKPERNEQKHLHLYNYGHPTFVPK